MKYILKLFVIVFVFGLSVTIFLSCNSGSGNQQNNFDEAITEENITKIEVIAPNHDFGSVEAGPVLVHKFKYKNTGDFDLIIRNVKTTCGCTVPKWSKAPLAPGEDGEIEVHFKTEGRYGYNKKDITIYANVPANEVVLSFTAEISNSESEQN